MVDIGLRRAGDIERTAMPPNGWDEWSKFVLSELKRLSMAYEGLRETSEGIRIEIAKLKVKAGIWGAIGGAIPVIVMMFLWWIKSGK